MKTIKNITLTTIFLVSELLLKISKSCLKWHKKLNRFVAIHHYSEYE